MDFAKPRDTVYINIILVVCCILWGGILVACQGLTNASKISGENDKTSTSIVYQAEATPKIFPSATPSPQPTSQFQIDPSALNGVSLNFWHSWSGHEEETINKLVDDFNKSNDWKIMVTPVYRGGYDDIEEKVYNAINTGGYPEIVMGYPYQAAKWSKVRNIILHLDEYRSDSEWGLTSEEEEAYYPIFRIQPATVNQWGFPAQRTAQFILYNKSWAEELGFKDAPETTSEFKSQACASHQAYLKDDDPENDTMGGLIISTNYPTTLAWIYAFDGEIIKQDGSGYQFNTTQVSNAFKFLRSLYDEGCAWVSNNQPQAGEFSGREGLFISGDLDTLSLLQTNMALTGNDDQWEPIPFPAAGGAPVIEVYGPDFFILESTPAKQLASWLFIKWLARPENQAKLIESSGKLALQPAMLEMVNLNKLPQPQWQAVQEMMQYAKIEPALPSWGIVRWAIGDATMQLFQWYFKADQIPNLVKLLDETAASLNMIKR